MKGGELGHERESNEDARFLQPTVEDDSMNADVFAGQWKQMRGELKAWWEILRV